MLNLTTNAEKIPLINICTTILHAANLAVFAIQIPFSLLNIGILSRTSLLHRNLKFVLLVQSVLFPLFALARSAQTIFIFIKKEYYYPISFKIILFLVDFPLLCFSFIGHILFIERIIATLLFKNYERAKSFLFSSIWLIILTFYAAVIAGQQAFKEQPQEEITYGVLISHYASLGICFFEIIAFSVMSALNLKMFTSKLKGTNNAHNLNERYQLAENIRTGRQLAPTFLLYFINVCAFFVPSVLSYYKFVSKPNLLELLWVIGILLVSISNTLIEYTLISRHPILRRNALRILCFRPFSMPIPCVQSVGGDNEAQNIGRIDGQKIEENKMNEMDAYFKILKQYW